MSIRFDFIKFIRNATKYFAAKTHDDFSKVTKGLIISIDQIGC